MYIQKKNAELARKILKDRSKVMKKHNCTDSSVAYESAIIILDYMLENNYECLNQFDYFGEE